MQEQIFRNFGYLLITFFLASTLAAEPAQVKRQISPAQELIEAIRQGGHILYMRHGPTDHQQKDSSRSDFSDCNQQRNLSEPGREVMNAIGVKIKALGIPVGPVLSSPYCRCKETAVLSFGKFELDANLQFSISKNSEEAETLGKYLRNRMMEVDTSQGNFVFVGHTSNLRDGLGVWPKPEGVVAVLQRVGSELIFRGLIEPKDWMAK